jgi:hypothetical protein
MTATCSRDAVTVTHRPARGSGLAAVVAALLAAYLVLPAAVTLTVVGVGSGVACLVVGNALREDDRPLLGGLGVVFGWLLSLAAVGYGAAAVERPETVVQVVVAGIGYLSIAAGVVPVRGDGSRRLVKFGTALVFLVVLAAAVLGTTGRSPLIVSAALLVVSFDLGENAINLGEQLGRRAETLPAELSHGAGTVGVAATGVVLARVAPSIGTSELSLSGVLLLAVALLGLSLSLHG